MMRCVTKIGVALAILAGLSPTALGGSSRLSMRVSPTRAYAPAKLWVYTRVETHRDNRAIEIVAESDACYRSSEIQLDGERAPNTSVFEFRSLPPGQYDVRAVLKGEGGRELEVSETQVTLFDVGRTDRFRGNFRTGT